MAKFDFGFIGCGNMGGALIRAIAPTVGGEKVLIADMLQSNTTALHDACGVCVAEDAYEVGFFSSEGMHMPGIPLTSSAIVTASGRKS